MQRITITIDDELLEIVDRMSEERGYTSRSEALRDIIRETAAREQTIKAGKTSCFATLSYIYEHETRDLARRLTSKTHHHHDLSVSTLHVHIDSRDCVEIAVLKGSVKDVKSFADGMISQRGVRCGNLHIMPMERRSGSAGHRHRSKASA